jgi:hypothetical protein
MGLKPIGRWGARSPFALAPFFYSYFTFAFAFKKAKDNKNKPLLFFLPLL